MIDTFYQQKLFFYLEPFLIKAGFTTEKIIFGYGDGPQPLGAYCIINITGIDDDIPPEVLYKYEDNPAKQIDEEILYRAVLTFTLDLYGNDALSASRQMRALFYSSDMIEMAQVQGFGFIGYGEAVNLTDIRNAGSEYRVSFPIQVNIVFTYAELIQTIGQVRVSGETDLGVQIMDEIITE